MELALIDLIVIFTFLGATLGLGFWISRKASNNMRSYFLGGNKLSWPFLGLSNASGMFDISGTMWMVYLMFVYGLKSIWIPWLWPVFNQIFLMIFMSVWLRRSATMTGAEWIIFRFGSGRGATFSHMVVVVFALLNVIGFLAYGFVGVGKFAAIFMPWELSADPRTNEILYGLIVIFMTSLYVVKGGMYSVVFTEVLQFIVMTVACIGVGVVAMYQVSPEMLSKAIPQGWDNLFFGWTLGLDWSGILDAANTKIEEDGWSLFSIFMMLVLFKGIVQSIAGPVPNYDMQRQLSARTPIEAAKMSALVGVVMLMPRYMLITGLTILALVYFMPELRAMGDDVDFELILPFAMSNFVPAGLLGLLIAGLLAAFMSTFAATTNAAPAYIVNDIYKRYINANASDKTYVYMSYAASVAFIVIGTAIGLVIPSLNAVIMWLVSALYGGYAASNVLKWLWWRFNGYGFFWGMTAGITAAIPLALSDFSALNAFPFTLMFCFAGSILGCLLTPATDMEVLKNFYRKTRPWGFWGPVYRELKKDIPGLERNTDFSRDMLNVVVGIVWQTGLTAVPIFLVIQSYTNMALAVAVVLGCSVFLKFNWYNKLKDYPDDVLDTQSIEKNTREASP
jgi:solute:Na+ symporter, SSS family